MKIFYLQNSLDDITPTMYNDGNDTYNNMNGNKNITYRNTNNTYRQQPPQQQDNELYYENEVLNELRVSNNSVQSNRLVPNQQYPGQSNQYKKHQLLPPLPNNSSSNQFNGQPQSSGYNNNNYQPNYIANTNGYPQYPNQGFTNQGVDPRAINNPYSGIF
jgi:hypothetical protein